MLDASESGNRCRGRHKTRWKDSCKRVAESVGLMVEDVLNMTKLNRYIHNFITKSNQIKSILFIHRNFRKRFRGVYSANNQLMFK